MPTTHCPASGKLPINLQVHVKAGGDVHADHYGWPFGRTVCNECGNTYEVTTKGLVRKHKPIHVATVSQWAREGLTKLVAENPSLQLPKF